MRLSPLREEPSVSVVVPARNSGVTLEAAVSSALAQDVPGGLEVVIAVGPSNDDTEDVARRLSSKDDRVRVIDNPAGSTPAALNAAVAESYGEVIARLDGHARFEPGYLAKAIELLRATGAANVGGVQSPVAKAGFVGAVAVAMRSSFGSGGAQYRSGGEPGPTETVYLGVFHREALEIVGGFDERLLRNQDYELNHRIINAGGMVYFHPGLVVRYRPRATPASLARQYYGYGAWKRRVLSMHPASLKLRQLIPPAFVVGLIGTAGLAVIGGPRWPFVGTGAAYLCAATASGLAAADAPSRVPAVVCAYAVMHLSWGIGFLVGRTRRG